MQYIYKCVYCGKEFEDYGNNPDCWDGRVWDKDDRCCDICNFGIVLPNRIEVAKMRGMNIVNEE